MRGSRLALVSLFLAAVPAAAWASEVVEFVDGRYLQIRSHELHGPVIRLNVERESFLVVPVDGVDAIRRDRQVVFRPAGPARPQAERGAPAAARRPQRFDRRAAREAGSGATDGG